MNVNHHSFNELRSQYIEKDIKNKNYAMDTFLISLDGNFQWKRHYETLDQIRESLSLVIIERMRDKNEIFDEIVKDKK